MTASLARQPETRALNEVVRFILARLDDDQRAVRQLLKQRADAGVQAQCDRRNDEIEAGRDIVGLLQRLAILRDLPAEQPVRDAALQMLRAMAKPYAEHRSFQPEWA